MTTTLEDEFLTIPQLCERYKRTRYTIYALQKQEGLPYTQIGGRRLTRKSDLLAWEDAKTANKIEADDWGDDED